MIKDTILVYYNGSISLEDALVIMEEERVRLEEELAFLKEFKAEQSEEIEILTKEFPNGYKGYSFEVRNGRTMYSFKNIKEWIDAEKHKKEIEKKYKSIVLAKINGSDFADIDENGEKMELPEISYGKPSVIIKKK